jgi:hypothetical protein
MPTAIVFGPSRRTIRPARDARAAAAGGAEEDEEAAVRGAHSVGVAVSMERALSSVRTTSETEPSGRSRGFLRE